MLVFVLIFTAFFSILRTSLLIKVCMYVDICVNLSADVHFVFRTQYDSRFVPKCNIIYSLLFDTVSDYVCVGAVIIAEAIITLIAESWLP